MGTKKKAAGKKAPASSPHKLIIEVVLRSDRLHGLRGAVANTRLAATTNFHFEITVPENVKLTKINIDGTKIEGEELEDLSEQAENRVIKGDKFVPLAIDSIFFVVEAVGEVSREVSVSLKYLGKDVTLDPSKFRIGTNRRGLLSLEEVNLP